MSFGSVSLCWWGIVAYWLHTSSAWAPQQRWQDPGRAVGLGDGRDGVKLFHKRSLQHLRYWVRAGACLCSISSRKEPQICKIYAQKSPLLSSQLHRRQLILSLPQLHRLSTNAYLQLTIPNISIRNLRLRCDRLTHLHSHEGWELYMFQVGDADVP